METSNTQALPTPEATVASSEQTPELSERDKIFAATNDPALSPDQFQLGDRTFKIVFLKYGQQLRFFEQLKPLVKVILALAPEEGLSIPDLSVGTGLEQMIPLMIDYMAEDLPALVAIICQQTDPSVTKEWVYENAESPFQLAGIVMQQAAINKMAQDIGRFFRLLMATKKMTKS